MYSPELVLCVWHLLTISCNLFSLLRVQKFKTWKGRAFTGKISIIGHSLGSIIAFDILANQRGEDWTGEMSRPNITAVTQQQPQVPKRVGILSSLFGTPPSSSSSNSSSNSNSAGSREQTEYFFPKYPQLNFEVLNSFMLGSPIAVFLLLRNRSIERDYKLPGCRKVFNIFHKFDPAVREANN